MNGLRQEINFKFKSSSPWFVSSERSTRDNISEKQTSTKTFQILMGVRGCVKMLVVYC